MKAFLNHLDDERWAIADINDANLEQCDLFVAPRLKMRGVVLGDEAVVLHARYHCTFRLNLRNLEYLQNYALLSLREPLDKKYVATYLAANSDSPYGLQNILNCVDLGVAVRDLTQFPPLYKPKTAQQQREGIDRIRAAGKSGDMVAVSNRKSGISRRIRELDRSPFSHVGMVYEPGVLAEVTTSGKAISNFNELEDPSYDVALYRLKAVLLTPEQEALMQRMWRNPIKYGWWDAIKTYFIRKFRLPDAESRTVGDLLYTNQFRLIEYV